MKLTRRNVLSGILGGAVAGLMPAVKAKTEPEPFEPDVVLDYHLRVTQHFQFYLDGKLQEYCFEARIKLSSFDKPTFGELVIGAEREGKSPVGAIYHKPQPGEFEIQNILVRSVTGMVEIKVDAEGREEYALWRKAMDEYL